MQSRHRQLANCNQSWAWMLAWLHGVGLALVASWCWLLSWSQIKYKNITDSKIILKNTVCFSNIQHSVCATLSQDDAQATGCWVQPEVSLIDFCKITYYTPTWLLVLICISSTVVQSKWCGGRNDIKNCTHKKLMKTSTDKCSVFY